MGLNVEANLGLLQTKDETERQIALHSQQMEAIPSYKRTPLCYHVGFNLVLGSIGLQGKKKRLTTFFSIKLFIHLLTIKRSQV